MNQYKNMLQNKDDEYMNLRRNLHTILYKNGALKSGSPATNSSEGQEQDNDKMTASNLLLSLNNWIENTHSNNEKAKDQEQNVEILMKQCDISSRMLAVKLLNEYNNDVSTAIFEYNQQQIINTKHASNTDELELYKNKVIEYEKKQKKFMNELQNNESIINQLRQSNHNFSLELNSRQEKYEKLEKQWIELCNEVDEITNTKNELEEECERLQQEVENHQSVLEETRISTQEMLDQEQDQNDKLMEEIQELEDANKVLLAQKNDLTKQLHSKLKNDLAAEGDNISNIQSLQDEIEMISEENERLKMNVNSLKEINKKNLHEKDEDIIELNTVINTLKLEVEELRALQTDYLSLTEKHNKLKQDHEIKNTAFNNLQIAFDALQSQLNKLKNESAANNSSMELMVNKPSQNDKNSQQLQIRLNEMTAKYENVTKQFQEIRAKFTQSQKYQIRLEHETSQLRSTISKTAVKLKNLSNSEDQVDRRIIIKLLVTFFDRWYNGGDTKEVISLISKILRFSDKECKKCRVGKYGQNNNTHNAAQGIWGYATSWMSYGNDNDTEENKNDDSTPDTPKDLGSLWVEFLLNELHEEQPNSDNANGTNTNTNAPSITQPNHNNDNNLTLTNSSPSIPVAQSNDNESNDIVTDSTVS